MRLIVEPIWTWPVVVLTIVGLLAMVLRTYPPRIRHLPKFTRAQLIGMRIATIVVIAFAMLRPAFQLTEVGKNSALLIVLMDQSRSMGTADGPGGTTRREALLETLDNVSSEMNVLLEDLEIRYYNFSEELTPTESPENKTPGHQTAIGLALDTAFRERGGKRVAGILLLSDGAQRAIAPFDADPRLKARLMGEQQIPVYSVAFGASGISEGALDIAVEDLLVDPLVFEKTSVPVTAKIRALGAKGRALTVKLMVEDRKGVGLGESGEMKPAPAVRNAKVVMQIIPNRNAEVIPVELMFVPQQPGEFKLSLLVEPVEGELKVKNNVVETIITVQRGGLKVAYFDKWRPEQRWVREALASEEKIQLDFQLIHGGNFRRLTKIDSEMFEPDAYDVYIIGDVPADVFGDGIFSQLASRIDEGAGFIMTGGFHNFSAGGYGKTKLADLLPVQLQPIDQIEPDKISEEDHLLKPLRMMPVRQGLNHYVMQLGIAGSRLEQWQKLAPMEGANRLKAKSDFVNLLAQTEEGVPLLFAHEVGQARVMAFAADTTYQWVLHGMREPHHRFWRQIILWLAKKELEGDQAVWVRVDPRNYSPGNNVTLSFGARDEQQNPLTDVKFTVEVTNPAGQVAKLNPLQNGSEFQAEFRNSKSPGDYWVKVRAQQGENIIGLAAMTRFIVDAKDLELDNPAADLALLEEISLLSGGTAIPPEQLQKFLQLKIEDESWGGEFLQHSRIALWDNWWVLSAFVTLMSVEWFVRKRKGLV